MIIIYAFLIPLVFMLGLLLPLAFLVRSKLNTFIQKQYEEKLRQEQAAEERRKQREEAQRKRDEEIRESKRKRQIEIDNANKKLREDAERLKAITAEKKEKARQERIKQEAENQRLEKERLQKTFDGLSKENQDGITAIAQPGTDKFIQAIKDHLQLVADMAEKKDQENRQINVQKVIENEREVIKKRMRKHNIRLLDKWAP